MILADRAGGEGVSEGGAWHVPGTCLAPREGRGAGRAGLLTGPFRVAFVPGRDAHGTIGRDSDAIFGVCVAHGGAGARRSGGGPGEP
jgi:hypothetical protein